MIKNPHNINEHITAQEVRLVGDNVVVGVYPLQAARNKATELELDLVEISPKADPPVCKIIDYKKFLYEQKKREKAMKAKATKVIVKEIRFGPQTDDHDYQFKKRHAEKFLKEGRFPLRVSAYKVNWETTINKASGLAASSYKSSSYKYEDFMNVEAMNLKSGYTIQLPFFSCYLPDI